MFLTGSAGSLLDLFLGGLYYSSLFFFASSSVFSLTSKADLKGMTWRQIATCEDTTHLVDTLEGNAPLATADTPQ